MMEQVGILSNKVVSYLLSERSSDVERVIFLDVKWEPLSINFINMLHHKTSREIIRKQRMFTYKTIKRRSINMIAKYLTMTATKS